MDNTYKLYDKQTKKFAGTAILCTGENDKDIEEFFLEARKNNKKKIVDYVHVENGILKYRSRNKVGGVGRILEIPVPIHNMLCSKIHFNVVSVVSMSFENAKERYYLMYDLNVFNENED